MCSLCGMWMKMNNKQKAYLKCLKDITGPGFKF